MKALSVEDLLKKRTFQVRLSDVWHAAIGAPELKGSWLIYGSPKNGKTSFGLQIANELSSFGKVLYDTIEEGFSLSFQNAVRREKSINKKVVFVEKEYFEDLIKRLDKPKSPKFVIIDSLQFSDINIENYRILKNRYKSKLFIYLSHIKGGNPDGSTAIKIMRDSNVVFKINGFRAFPTSRYGGGEMIDICPELSEKYWNKIVEN